MAWYNAGRVLVRFLKVAIDAHMLESIITLQAEVGFVQCVSDCDF